MCDPLRKLGVARDDHAGQILVVMDIVSVRGIHAVTTAASILLERASALKPAG